MSDDNDPNWISKRFGYPDKNGKRRTKFGIKLRHGMTDEGWSEYRSDLARFPGDPQAYVDGPAAKQKLIDQRKREGWVEGPSFSDVAANFAKQPEVNSEAMVREAYARAEATGFRDEGETNE
tara:strand:- start:3537 stop:3902 length:366 start_codon:yes stop_codon:yes gene_type:complete